MTGAQHTAQPSTHSAYRASDKYIQMGASASLIPENLLSRGFSENELPPGFRAILDFEKMPKNSDGEVLLKSLVAGLENKKDIFMSHEWGADQGVHRFVSRINKCLQDRGARTWMDESEMEGDMNEKMSRGIDDSRVVIVFVTKGYIAKVNSDNANDNCKKVPLPCFFTFYPSIPSIHLYLSFLLTFFLYHYALLPKEFNYAVNRKSTAKMLLVVLDLGVSDTKKWDGPFGLSMGTQIYVPFFDHSEGVLNSKADEILAAIEKKTGGRLINKLIDLIDWKIQNSATTTALAVNHKDVANEHQSKLDEEMSTWLVQTGFEITTKTAHKYADAIVNKADIPTVKKLTNKLKKNRNYLETELEFDEDDAEAIAAFLLEGKSPKEDEAASEIAAMIMPVMKEVLPTKPTKPAHNIQVGRRVQADFQGKGSYSFGVVSVVNIGDDQDTFGIDYDGGQKEANVPLKMLRIRNKLPEASRVDKMEDLKSWGVQY